jgi:hypothetical protein
MHSQALTLSLQQTRGVTLTAACRPRYCFQINRGQVTVPDHEGVELIVPVETAKEAGGAAALLVLALLVMLNARLARYGIAQWADNSPMGCEFAFASTANAAGLSLDRTGKAGDVVFDEERVYERHGNRPEQCPSHKLAPIKHIATD